MIGLVTCCVRQSMANYVTNGDFSSGVLSPWMCVSAWCQVEEEFLQVRERKEEWAGPRQNIPAEFFTADEDLKVGFNFSVRSGAVITTEWKMKITKSGETNYYLIQGLLVTRSGKIYTLL